MDDVKALFGLIDKKNKRRLLGAVICCVLSVLCGILPYLGVWGIVTCFLDERTENLFQLCVPDCRSNHFETSAVWNRHKNLSQGSLPDIGGNP